MNQTILVAEDNVEVGDYLDMALRCRGYAVSLARDGIEAVAKLIERRENISLVLMDVFMPLKDGIEALREIRRHDSKLPVILFSAAASGDMMETAAENGATDFLPHPLTHTQLYSAIDKAVNGSENSREPAPHPVWRPDMAPVLPKNPEMCAISGALPRIARSDVPVILQGESGVGKEVLARQLHAKSARANKAFLKLNCAAVPSELLESELFGYERGAYTGAFKSTPGKFEAAEGGTILLDEIGDMDLRLQAKLLHVLQDHEFQRLGGRETVRVDVRILTATHQNLERAVATGRFRQDLYYRLNVITIHIPPLRERRDEILPLAQLFVQKHAAPRSAIPRITPELAQALLDYCWPGNIRELENAIRKFLVYADAAALASELRANTRRLLSAKDASLPLESSRLDEAPFILQKVHAAKDRAETQAILAALEANRWNRKRAAAMLNVDYKGLLYKMRKLGIAGLPKGNGYGEAV